MNKKLTKQEQIDIFLKEQPEVGELVYVKNKHISSNSYKKDVNMEDFYYKSFTVTKIDKNTGTIWGKEESYRSITEIPVGDYKRSVYEIGSDPFHRGTRVSNINFTLEIILHQLGLLDKTYKTEYFLKETNGEGVKIIEWNPFVIDKKGNKYYYQRELCWTLEDKQSLIESIYNGINCGGVLIRPRGFKWVESMVNKGKWGESAWYDVVDGKQRLHTIYEFINNKFPDKHGNLYNDLSNRAQNDLLNHQLISYITFDESVNDNDVIETFIRLNDFGKIVSKEHMDSVKKINNIIK